MIVHKLALFTVLNEHQRMNKLRGRGGASEKYEFIEKAKMKLVLPVFFFSVLVLPLWEKNTPMECLTFGCTLIFIWCWPIYFVDRNNQIILCSEYVNWMIKNLQKKIKKLVCFVRILFCLLCDVNSLASIMLTLLLLAIDLQSLLSLLFIVACTESVEPNWCWFGGKICFINAKDILVGGGRSSRWEEE